MYRIPHDVRAISFDVWSTLLKGNQAFTKPRLRLIFEALGLDGVDIEEVHDAYKRADGFYNDEAVRRGIDFDMADRLGMMFAELGIKAKVLNTKTVRRLQEEVAELRCRPEYMPTLMEPDLQDTLQALLSQGYKLGLLSNTGMDDRRVVQGVLVKLNLWDLFQVHVFSSDDGRAKPNPGLFRRMADEFDLAPVDVLHVGDNATADYRASEAGLHAVLYAPQGAPENWKGHFITSMKQLLE